MKHKIYSDKCLLFAHLFNTYADLIICIYELHIPQLLGLGRICTVELICIILFSVVFMFNCAVHVLVLILYVTVQRFTKNTFILEKNPTIVNFPVK